MPDYRQIVDADIWNFIQKTQSLYPDDMCAQSIEAPRQSYKRICDYFQGDLPANLTIKDKTIGKVRVRIYGKASHTSLIFFHGGGFVVGNLDSHHSICAEFALASGLQVIAVDYRLSPENRHPAAYEDGLSVCKHYLVQGDIILLGDSAGATLAATICGTLNPVPYHPSRIIGQVLIYPSLCDDRDMNRGSYITHANAPMLSRTDALYYASVRQGKPDDPTHNPMQGNFSLVPPSMIFVAECDPLYDDGFIYAKKLRQHGGKVKVNDEKGLVHGYLRARHSSQRAMNSFQRISTSIHELLVIKHEHPDNKKPVVKRCLKRFHFNLA